MRVEQGFLVPLVACSLSERGRNHGMVVKLMGSTVECHP